MGLFSGKTRTHIFSNAVPLVDEDYNPVAEAIVKSIIKGQNPAQSIIDTVINSTSLAVNNMMNYARNHYTLGLPQGAKHITDILDDTEVASIITTDLTLPYGCLVEYHHITELSADAVLLPFLTHSRGYDIRTNRIDSNFKPPGLVLEEYYLHKKDHPLTHRISVSSILYDEPTKTITIRYAIDSSYSKLTYDVDYIPSYVLQTLPTTYHDEYYVVPDGFRIGRMYCVAKYFELDEFSQITGIANWWFYDMSSGTYPLLEAARTNDPNADFFPVVPVRYQNVDYTADDVKTTDLYKTSKQLLKKVNLDLDFLGEKINKNPDIAEIDHAYVMFGVNLQTERKESLLYLMEFFDDLYDAALIQEDAYLGAQLNGAVVKQVSYDFNNSIVPGGTTTKTLYTESDGGGGGGEPYQVVVINSTAAASLVEHGLDTSIHYNAIRSRYKSGSIGPVGTVTKTLVPDVDGYRLLEYSRTHTDNSQLILQHQISETVYKEIVVTGMYHTNRIYGDASIYTNLRDIIDDPTNDNFIIPLHYGVCKRLPLIVRNKVYLQSLYLIINGVHFTHVKWYQSAFFKALTFVFAAIVSIWTGNPWLLAITVGMEIISPFLSLESMVFLKAAYVLYSIYSMNWGALAKTMSDAAYFLGMVAAISDLAQIPNQLKLIDIAGEFEDLALEKELKEKELEVAWEALDTSSFLNAGILLDSPLLQSPWGEGPEDFYTRTLTNNAGLLALNVVENYHDTMLSLPEVNPHFSLLSPSYT